jgi:hypothetical protein
MEFKMGINTYSRLLQLWLGLWSARFLIECHYSGGRSLSKENNFYCEIIPELC